MIKDIPGIMSLISLVLTVIFGLLAGIEIDDIFIPLVIISIGLFFIFLSIHYVINDMTKKREIVNVIPVLILGIISTIIGIIQLLNLQDKAFEILVSISKHFPEMTILDIVGGFLILIGMGIIIIPEIIRIKKEKRCIYVVEGTVVDLYRSHQSYRVKYPVYSYTYNGKEYFFQDTGRNFSLPKVGDKEEIYINPDDPEDAILRVNYVRVVRNTLGIFYIIGGLLCYLNV